ncbi:hypothetical protein [Pseudophaeobacter sp. EL27]|uniref:hypothetical protein n=1 Tax=Pseudophaeobacter sp. EL27 TaxID=2107580 RepID=UPI0020B124A3|nr:hypothetical protein [Pseudophaeobacter sp. EL27]
MNAFAKIRTELTVSDTGMRTTDVILAARAAAGILEWLELTTPTQAADLARSCFDATIAHSQDAAHIHLYGVDAIDKDLGTALRLWCGQVLRYLGAMGGTDPLVTFLQAFHFGARDKFHAITMATAKLGAGSWVDPTLPAQRVTSHFYEIEMFGVLGRGDSPTAATDSWHMAALAELPARNRLVRQGVAA